MAEDWLKSSIMAKRAVANGAAGAQPQFDDRAAGKLSLRLRALREADLVD